MRTTVDIEDDVLLAVGKIARREKKSVGQVISALVRSSLAQVPRRLSGVKTPTHAASERLISFGIQPLPARGGLVTNELIDRLRGKLGL